MSTTTIYTTHYVYSLTRTTNLKSNPLPHSYIGVRSCNGPAAHDTYMSSSKYVKEAMDNGEQFNKTILCVLETRKEAERVEHELQIKKNVLSEDYYNRCIHAVGFSLAGEKHTEAAILKMSKVKLGKTKSPETRKRMSYAKQNLSDEAKRNISISARNKPPMSEAQKQKIRETLTGRKHSEAAKLKMSKARIGRKHSEATKQKIRLKTIEQHRKKRINTNLN